jgi:tetratricopeptide (TPR) repeat protein
MKYFDTLKRRLVYVGAAFPANTIEITTYTALSLLGESSQTELRKEPWAMSLSDHTFQSGNIPTIDTDVVTGLNKMAEFYFNHGEYAQAERLYQRTLAIYEKAREPESFLIATSLDNLADLYHAQGEYAQAEPLYRRALAIWEKMLGTEHLHVAGDLNNLAGLCHAQGEYTQAERFYQRALAIWEAVPEVGYPDALIAMENYVDLLRKTRREREAIELEIRAHFIRVTYVQETTPESEWPKN